MSSLPELINDLPLVLQNSIFYFVPVSGTAKVMRDAINVYEKDRVLTKRYNWQYIKDKLSFSNYIYHGIFDPSEFEYGPPTIYNKNHPLM